LLELPSTVVEEAPAGPGLKAVRFAETPRMSTYLLAFVVGDLACVEATTPEGTTMRVWATRGNQELGRFALEVSLRLLEYYNDYFGIPFPLEKLDHIAIPDFAAGAMENLGAITFRETLLLVDETQAAHAIEQAVMQVTGTKLKSLAAGRMGYSTSEVGDLVVEHLSP